MHEDFPSPLAVAEKTQEIEQPTTDQLREEYRTLLRPNHLENQGYRTLSDEEKEETDAAIATALNMTSPEEQDNWQRVFALNTLFSYGRDCLPNISEMIQRHPTEEDSIELAKLMNHIAEREDFSLVLHTLPYLDKKTQEGQNESSGEIASRTLIRLVDNVRHFQPKDPNQLRNISQEIIQLLNKSTFHNEQILYNCRSALALSDTPEAIRYLLQFEADRDYISKESLLAEQEKYLSRIELLPPDSFDYLDHPYTVEEWQKVIRRLIRRALIEKHTANGNTLQEVKNLVRQEESDIGINTFIDSLVDKEFTPSPEMTTIADKVSVAVRNKFPHVKAIVQMGSSIHGGAIIRKITNSEDVPDFDYGVITDTQLSPEEAAEVEEYVDTLLPALGQAVGYGTEMKSCLFITPIVYHARTLETAQDTFPLLTNVTDEETRQQIVMYLQPSSPPEINEKNRTILKEALRKLRQENHPQYLECVSKVLEEWITIHKLKIKHFGISLSSRTNRRLVNITEMEAPEKMSKPMKSFLKDT